MQQNAHNSKRAQIDKANVTMVLAVAICAFVAVFSLVSTRAMWQRQSYQNKVIEKREAARNQLAANVEESKKLTESYKQFISSTENVIGGNPAGNGERDGDNARIVLDALPSKYDFPALTSSVEKLARDKNLKIENLSGTDDEVAQSQAAASSTPVAVEMPFTLGVSGTYDSVKGLIDSFEKSIRPFRVTKMVFTGASNGEVKLIVDAKSYYQPEKSLEFKKEVVK